MSNRTFKSANSEIACAHSQIGIGYETARQLLNVTLECAKYENGAQTFLFIDAKIMLAVDKSFSMSFCFLASDGFKWRLPELDESL